MDSSPWKLVGASPRLIQPGVLRRNWSTRILGHWIVLILVIAISTALLPWLQFLRARAARRQESYVLFPVFTRELGLHKGRPTSRNHYSVSANTTRRLLVFPFDYMPPQDEKLPPWDPYINAWQANRHFTEESLFLKLNVANVTYFLDLDFKSHLIWINCKWTPKDKRSTWTKVVDKLKPRQLHGPSGLYVPKHENWCDTRICGQLNSGDAASSCKMDLCHFTSPYGQEENIEGVVLRDNAVLCNSSVSVNDTNYRLLNLAFGCVYKRRSKATGKKTKYKKKLGSDGVLGINQGPLSFPSQLYERNMAENSIALCLAKTKRSSAGYIAFGYPVRQMGDAVPWVPLERGAGSGTYQVVLDNIKYGDDIVMLGPLLKRKFDIIIDGSSRFTYLDNEIFMAFEKIVKRWAKKDGFDFQEIEGEEGTCWSFWKATIGDFELRQRFNNVKFMIGGALPRREMLVKAENFLISPAEGLVCLAIRSSDDIKQPGINILGGMAMKEHLILIDKMTDQFGWLDDEKCEQHRLVKLRVTTSDRVSAYRCNPFTFRCT